jgi:hypothetical protein
MWSLNQVSFTSISGSAQGLLQVNVEISNTYTYTFYMNSTGITPGVGVWTPASPPVGATAYIRVDQGAPVTFQFNVVQVGTVPADGQKFCGTLSIMQVASV